MSQRSRIVQADLGRRDHRQAIVKLTNAYAADPMANGKALPKAVLKKMVAGLRKHPTTLVLLAFVGEEAVGIATCFRGYSTFAAKPLINIHDLGVLPNFRGRGIGRQLLDAVAKLARKTGCCKLTLEVQQGNRRARGVYHAAGFSQGTYADGIGGSLFYAKPL
ncbi:MAG: GNAT family N-acetyltransferase [Planctomycetes bacterium]|nr:GNAT family N-acetyltransferase [Planctomycetota bacterium]